MVQIVYATSLAWMLRWYILPAIGLNGHSQATTRIPSTKLIDWSTGTGSTRKLRAAVEKSHVTFGQKKPMIEPPIWIAAATSTRSRAQWFLTSLPITGGRRRWNKRMDRNEIHVGRWFSRKSGVDRSTSSLDGLCQAPEYISRSLMCAKTSVSSIMMRLPIYRGVPTTARCGRKVCQFCLLKGLMRILRKWLLKTRHVPRIVLIVLPLR